MEEQPQQDHDAPTDTDTDTDTVAGDLDPTAETGGRTGVAAVDGVLDQMDGLSERPVDEHVGVFEEAHERLRRALDASDG